MGYVLDWSFFVLHFYGNVCIWIPKLTWTEMDWFWGFLLEYTSFRRCRICMDWNLQEVLICVSILMTWCLFDNQFSGSRGILVPCLNVPVLFSHRIPQKLIDELYQCNLISLPLFARPPFQLCRKCWWNEFFEKFFTHNTRYTTSHCTKVARNSTCRTQIILPAFCRWIHTRCDSRLPTIGGTFRFEFRGFCLRLWG